jgi:hypothetical protein
MSKLTLAEQYTLRALTGRVVGQAMAQGAPDASLGVITNKSYICASLVGALEAAQLAEKGGLTEVKTALAEGPEAIKAAVEAVKDADVIFLAFGGELGPEVNKPLTEAALLALKEAGFVGEIFFHVRIWAPGFVKEALDKHPELKEYLEELPMGTFTFDLDKGVFILHDVYLEDGELKTEPLRVLPLTHEHLELLKRSL